jgi:acetyl esterase/lipase
MKSKTGNEPEIRYGPPSEDARDRRTLPRLAPALSAQGQAWAGIHCAFSARTNWRRLKFGRVEMCRFFQSFGDRGFHKSGRARLNSSGFPAIAAFLVVILAAIASAPAAAQDLKIPDDVTFKSNVAYRENGPPNSWVLDYAMPKDLTGAPRPAIVMIHGGGWIEGDKSSFDRYCVDFAKLGYFCATINYRLSGVAPFPAAVEDSKCAIRWLRAHANEFNVDVDRIGVYGNSAGGHLALMVAMAGKEAALEGDGPYADQSSAVQCAVSDSGIVNLDYTIPNNAGLVGIIDKFLIGPKESMHERMVKASPSSCITSNTPPLLLLYGNDDTQVTIGPVDDFVLALQKAGVQDMTYIRLAKVGHCPFSLVGVPWTRHVIEDFYARTLMMAEPPATK